MPFSAPLAITADLTLEHQDQPALRLHGDGNVLQADLDSVQTGLRLARQNTPGLTSKRRLLSHIAQLLITTRLQVEVRVRERIIVRIGNDTRSGLVERLAGLNGVKIYPLSIVRAVLKR